MLVIAALAYMRCLASAVEKAMKVYISFYRVVCYEFCPSSITVEVCKFKGIFISCNLPMFPTTSSDCKSVV